MMYEGYWTAATSQEVRRVIQPLFDSIDSQPVGIIIIKSELAEPTEMFRVSISHFNTAVITLANGQEIIRFVTSEGQRLDLLFPKPEDQNEPCLVFLAENHDE